MFVKNEVVLRFRSLFFSEKCYNNFRKIVKANDRKKGTSDDLFR